MIHILNQHVKLPPKKNKNLKRKIEEPRLFKHIQKSYKWSISV